MVTHQNDGSGERELVLLGIDGHCLWTEINSWRHNITVSAIQNGGLRRSGEQWNFSSNPSRSHSSCLLNIHCGYFLSSRIYHCNRHAQQLAEFLSWFSKLWSYSYYGGKDQMEATRTAFTWGEKKKKVKLKQCSIPGNCRDCPHQGVGGYDTVIPTIPITHLTSAENRS